MTDTTRTSFLLIFLVTLHLTYDWLPDKEQQCRHFEIQISSNQSALSGRTKKHFFSWRPHFAAYTGCTFSSYREQLKKKVKKILCIRGPFYSRIHQATGGIIDTFSTSLNGDLIAHNSPTTSSLTSFRFHVTTECLWIAMKSISDKMLRSLRNYFEYRYFGLKRYGKKKTNKMLTVPLHYVCHILTINIRFWHQREIFIYSELTFVRALGFYLW